MIERDFVKQKIKEFQIEEFVSKNLTNVNTFYFICTAGKDIISISVRILIFLKLVMSSSLVLLQDKIIILNFET